MADETQEQPYPNSPVHVGLDTLKADAQAWAKVLIDELAAKVEGGLPNAQAALDAWVAKL
jgi:hypothetical protein